MKDLEKDLRKHSNKNQAKNLQRFFKTGKGEYGEGDVFLGIKVPKQREIAREAAKRLNVEETIDLLNSNIHEKRLIGLLILIEKYNTAKKENNEHEKEIIFNAYLKNAKAGRINNWDLIDLSAPRVVGDFLLNKKSKRQILYELAKSDNLWERRIAIISCSMFIREGDFKDALAISELLLKDKHDLIHKAVGWMLREIGKRDEKVLKGFLGVHYKEMPRTMLRYAIEKFEEEERRRFLLGTV